MSSRSALFIITLTSFCLAPFNSFAETIQNGPFYVETIKNSKTTLPPILNTPVDKNGLKVFWWNVRDGGELAKKKQKEQVASGNKSAVNEMDANLSALAQSPNAPEVILLGEFETNTLSDLTTKTLKFFYPYQQYLGFNAYLLERGIQVYSQYPFETNSSLLDWSPVRQTLEKQNTYKSQWRNKYDSSIDYAYERVFSDLVVHKNGTNWNLCPVHLLDNWLNIAAKIGTDETGLVLLFGTENPHYYQVQRLVEEKIQPILKSSTESNLILIGDFNLPNEVYHVVPGAFRLLLSSLKVSRQEEFTFPAVDSDVSNLRKLTIDHAFHSPNLQTNDISRIPFSGSDHYPIEVQVSKSK